MADCVVLDAYTVEPGECYLCRGSQRQMVDGDGTTRAEKVVDTNIDIEVEGRLYLCESCLTYIAESLLGFASPRRRSELESELAAVRANLDQVMAELRDVDAALSALVRVPAFAEHASTDLPDYIERTDDGAFVCTECDRRRFETHNGAHQHVTKARAHAG